MSELKTRVDELKMENEYQLRMKDMNYNAKIKDLTDKFLQEIDSLKAKIEVRTYVHVVWYVCDQQYAHACIPQECLGLR